MTIVVSEFLSVTPEGDPIHPAKTVTRGASPATVTTGAKSALVQVTTSAAAWVTTDGTGPAAGDYLLEPGDILTCAVTGAITVKGTEA